MGAWRLWMRAIGQWRTTGLGGLLGLDYNALWLVAGALGLVMDEALLGRIQALEAFEARRQNERSAP